MGTHNTQTGGRGRRKSIDTITTGTTLLEHTQKFFFVREEGKLARSVKALADSREDTVNNLNLKHAMINMTMTSSRANTLLLLALVSIDLVLAGDRDRFNYYGTTERTNNDNGNVAIDYGPDDWNKLDCLGGPNHDVDLCVS